MKKNYMYTVLFMLTVSVLFSGMLAFTNSLSAEKIETNQGYAEKKAVLDTLGIAYGNTAAGVDNVFTADLEIYPGGPGGSYIQKNTDGSVLAYAFRFSGNGLWGRIEGYIGISGDMKRITGIEFFAQNETPGLGGRITEKWFKDQFIGIDLENEVPITYGGKIDAVSGATLTSNAVLKILNTFIENELQRAEVKR